MTTSRPILHLNRPTAAPLKPDTERCLGKMVDACIARIIDRNDHGAPHLEVLTKSQHAERRPAPRGPP